MTKHAAGLLHDGRCHAGGAGEVGMKGWHFCTDDRRLGYGDGRKIIAGETITVDCKPVLCQSGLHASEKPLDALKYARGNVVSYVDLRGIVVFGEDKAVATERYTYWITDAEKVLRKFACWCALEVAHLWGMPEITRQYLETQDANIQAAAWDSAQAAARDAAWDSAWVVAWDAAWAAARAAAWDAAWAAVWDEQNKKLEKMLMELPEAKRSPADGE